MLFPVDVAGINEELMKRGLGRVWEYKVIEKVFCVM
jgi:hypothetical protein